MFDQRLCSVLLAVAGLPLTTSAASADADQLEMNATCAVVSGCFPGDAPGYPVTITAAGAYRLTGPLLQSAIPGVSTPSNAIEIASDDVRIDLAGFRIACNNPLSGGASVRRRASL